jgi:hypothetical protein|tara:strand:- start:646 stop:1491 length:846 start_codon:yes stop_codon:yes gene_type:complete
MEEEQTINKKTPQDENNTLMAWLNRDDPMIIATHQQVDADAAFSAALLHILKPNAPVVFVRADSTISQAEVIAVDLMNGTSAVKGLGVGSAFGLVVSTLKGSDPAYYKVLKPWAKQLNLTDQAKYCNDAVVLADMVSAWRSVGLDDQTIVERAGELLLGKLKFTQRRERQKVHASKIQIQGGVAVLGPEDHVPAKQLFQRGAKAVVRQGKDGMAVILSRNAQEAGLSLVDLESSLNEEWFFHPDGFLASYGGPKAPKNPSEAGITIKSLAKRTRKLIKVVN